MDIYGTTDWPNPVFQPPYLKINNLLAPHENKVTVAEGRALGFIILFVWVINILSPLTLGRHKKRPCRLLISTLNRCKAVSRRSFWLVVPSSGITKKTCLAAEDRIFNLASLPSISGRFLRHWLTDSRFLDLVRDVDIIQCIEGPLTFRRLHDRSL